MNEKVGNESPIEDAIEWCIRNDVLKEFLEARKTEVLKAMTLDMTFERREELIRRDERAEGRAEIIRNALASGRTEKELSQLFGILNISTDEVDKVAATVNKL